MATSAASSTPLASIGYLIGRGLLVLAAFHAFPILVGFQNNENTAAYSFILAGMLSAFAGGLLTFTFHGSARPLRRREAIVMPAIGFVAFSFFAGIGIYLTGSVSNLGEATFEALSGLTTTGASILNDVDTTLHTVLAWRAMLEWMGGLIAIGLALAIAPSLNLGGAGLTTNALPHGEGESMIARFRGVLPPLIPVYTLLTVLCMILLWLGGLPGFDALCHAMATVSSGGFSTRNGSLAAFQAPLAEWLIIPFLLMSAINATYLWAALRGRSRLLRYDRELRLLLILTGAGALVVATGHLALTRALGDGSWLESIRVGLFAAASAISTTGFSGSAGAPLTLLGVYTLSALVFAGGMTGSTAGGLKMMRVVLLFRNAFSELARLTHPSRVRAIRLNLRVVGEESLLGVWTLYFVFLSALAALTAAFTGTGADLSTSFFLSLSAISNAGPIIHTLDPDFAGFPAVGTAGRVIYAAGMIIGRLEVMFILAAFTAWFWKD